MTVHHTGRVRLGKASSKRRRKFSGKPDTIVAPDEVYAVYFHGPAYQVLAGAGGVDGVVVGAMTEELPDNHTPDAPTTMHPRLVELVFQTAGIWEMGTERSMGLPMEVGRVVVRPGPASPKLPFRAIVTPTDDGFDADVVDAAGNVHVEVGGYRTVVLPGGLEDALVDPMTRAVSG